MLYIYIYIYIEASGLKEMPGCVNKHIPCNKPKEEGTHCMHGVKKNGSLPDSDTNTRPRSNVI